MRLEDIKLIEEYLSGDLNQDEKLAFESRMKEDTVLADEVERHKLFVKKVKNAGERNSLQNKLDELHAQLTEKDLKYKPEIGKVLHVLWKQNYISMSVAASVAFFIATSVLLVSNYVKQSGNNQFAYYKELKRDVEKLKKSQKVIINTLDSKTKVPNAGATAFVISRKGYLLTSYHTVKDADSLIVENGKYARLKVKLVYSDPIKDLALLRVTDKKFKVFKGLNVVVRSRKTRLGEKVFTLGYPKEDVVYGEGSIASATGYEGDETAFQISVPVNPGNSGSPLFDNNGYVVGMISGKHLNEEGSSFAIKPRFLLDFVNSIPKDSIEDFRWNKSISISVKNRADQIEMMKDFVLMLKVYKE